MSDDDVLVASSGIMATVSEYLYPAARLLVAGLAVWYSSAASA